MCVSRGVRIFLFVDPLSVIAAAADGFWVIDFKWQ